MGAINYGTSDYISIGLDVSEDFEDFELAFIADNIDDVLCNYSFEFFSVSLKPGYYDGYYIDLREDLPYVFTSCEEKQAAQKEITAIGRFLRECVAAGMVQYFPGWCTGYSSSPETIKAISAALRAMRDAVKTTRTRLQYERGAV